MAATQGLRWRQFGPDWVVYDVGSGDTSCLDAWAAAVLGLLETGAASEEALLEQLAAESVIDPARHAATLLDDALKTLQQLGLVQTSAA